MVGCVKFLNNLDFKFINFPPAPLDQSWPGHKYIVHAFHYVDDDVTALVS